MTVAMQQNLKEQLAERIASRESTEQFMPVGRGTKSGLIAKARTAEMIDVRSLEGIVAYDPSEFLISALAGTSLVTLQATLAEHGQYLPFDPMYVEAGSTLGGTIAAGVSGSSSNLYGTLRDFVMEIEFIDGLGKFVRGGGKVVKNAAGFDLPKLMVGSYGRLGILTEATLKVFPAPPTHATAIFQFDGLEFAIRRIQTLQQQPLPIEAVDLTPLGQAMIRIATSRDSTEALKHRLVTIIGKAPEQVLVDEEDGKFWSERSKVLAQENGNSLYVAYAVMSGAKTLAFNHSLAKIVENKNVYYTRSGTAAWIHLNTADQLAALDLELQTLDVSAVLLKGPSEAPTFLGSTKWKLLAGRVQRAIDPNQAFVAYN